MMSRKRRLAVTALAPAQSHVFSGIIAEAPPYSMRASLERITHLPWVPAMAEGDLPGAFAVMKERPILLLVGDTDPEISQAQGSSLLSGNVNAASGMVVFAKTGHGVFRDSNISQYRQSVSAFLHAVVKAG